MKRQIEQNFDLLFTITMYKLQQISNKKMGISYGVNRHSNKTAVQW